MDGDGAAAGEAAEPGHLAFGKLVDGVGQEDAHFFVGEDAKDVLGDEFVLETIVNKVIGRDAGSQQTANLLYEAFLQAGVKATVNAGNALFAGNQRTNVVNILGQEIRTHNRMRSLVISNLQSPDNTAFRLQSPLLCIRTHGQQSRA